MTQSTSFSDRLVWAALQAMSLEVICGPKPGLVDSFNSGSHQDMDRDSFFRSIAALKPHLMAYAQAGKIVAAGADSPEQLSSSAAAVKIFAQLQELGLEGEKASLRANQGINCHAGLNFAWALILPVAHYLYDLTGVSHPEPAPLAEGAAQTEPSKASARVKHRPMPPASDICQLVSRLASPVFVNWQAGPGRGRPGGARLAAAQGYTLALNPGLVTLQAGAGLTSNLSRELKSCADCKQLNQRRFSLEPELNCTLLLALLKIMSLNEDTNLLRRGGEEALTWVQSQAQHILEQFNATPTDSDLQTAILRDPDDFLQAVWDFDRVMIARNLSPGGSADLLALAIFFYLWETELRNRDD